MYKPSKEQELRNNTKITMEQLSLFNEGFEDNPDTLYFDDNSIPF